MKIGNAIRSILAAISATTIAVSCSEKTSAPSSGMLDNFKGRCEVEVAPGKFIEIGGISKSVDDKPKSVLNAVGMIVDNIRNGSEWTHIGIPWNGKLIEWKGEPIPVSLREYDSELYMIAYDRSIMDKVKLRFYMEDGTTFKEIRSSDFPKKIASQNMWFFNYYGNIGDKLADHIQATIDLDPYNVGFYGTMTADIWLCLMTGKELYEVNFGSEVADKLLIEYSEKYKPIKLTKILKQRPPLPEWYIEANKTDSVKYPLPAWVNEQQEEDNGAFQSADPGVNLN